MVSGACLWIVWQWEGSVVVRAAHVTPAKRRAALHEAALLVDLGGRGAERRPAPSSMQCMHWGLCCQPGTGPACGCARHNSHVRSNPGFSMRVVRWWWVLTWLVISVRGEPGDVCCAIVFLRLHCSYWGALRTSSRGACRAWTGRRGTSGTPSRQRPGRPRWRHPQPSEWTSSRQ